VREIKFVLPVTRRMEILLLLLALAAASFQLTYFATIIIIIMCVPLCSLTLLGWHWFWVLASLFYHVSLVLGVSVVVGVMKKEEEETPKPI
jgi:membrane protein implicated in regulation of membrane protease activity